MTTPTLFSTPIMKMSAPVLFSIPIFYFGYRYLRDNCTFTVIRTEEDRVNHVMKELFPGVNNFSSDHFAKAFFMPETKYRIMFPPDDKDEFYKALHREMKKQNPNLALSFEEACAKRDEVHTDILKTVERKVDEVFVNK